MSAAELRREFRKLQEEFLGGKSIGKLKKHEVEHRMSVLRDAMEKKGVTPEPAPTRGAPAAREVKTKEVSIDDETKVTKPVAPKGGPTHSTSYKKRPKAEEVVEKPAPKPRAKTAPKPPKLEVEEVAAAPAEKPKKPRRVPPKVVLKEDDLASAPVEAKPKPKPKSKATAPPKTDLPAPEPETPPAPAPAPVVEKPVKLPGGCRALPATDLYLN